jgi:hypothetical protein
VVSLDGQQLYIGEESVPCFHVEDAVRLGKSVGQKLIEQGAGKIIGDLTAKRAITYGSAETAGLRSS